MLRHLPADQVPIVRYDELGLTGRHRAGGPQGLRTIGRHLPVAEPHRTVVPLELVARVRPGHGGCAAWHRRKPAGVSACRFGFVRIESVGA
eukprot:scaffold7277_cov62-Phaeocystis_antarctica.AAC.1